MRDILSFHSTGHGRAVRFLPGRTDFIERDPKESWCGGGIAFSAPPVKPGQKVCLQVHLQTELPGSLRLGFTSVDPGLLRGGQLPPYLIPDLTDTEGYWARAVSPATVAHRAHVTVILDSSGHFASWEVNGLSQGILVDGLDAFRHQVWLAVDLYGPVSALCLLPPDDIPVEILARGPTAVNAYRQACNASNGGSALSSRIQVVLIGQDITERVQLKQYLLSSYESSDYSNIFDLSCSAIDLSASYRYGKMYSSETWSSLTPTTPMLELANPLQGSLSKYSPEAARLQAIAENVVLSLLHKQKKMIEYQNCVASQTSFFSVREPRLCDEVPGAPSGTTTRSEFSASSIVGQLDSEELLQGDDVITSELDSDDVLNDVKTLRRPTDGSSNLLEGQPREVVELVNKMMANSVASKKTEDPVILDINEIEDDISYTLMPQVFLSYRALYIAMFDLRYDLDQVHSSHPDVVSASYDGNTVSSTFTNSSPLDFLDFWLHCVHSSSVGNSVSERGPLLSPAILIVGTHRSALDSNVSEQYRLAELQFAKVRQLIRGKPYEHHVVSQFFAVDYHISNDSQLVDMKRSMEQIAWRQPCYNERVPCQWIRCDHLLRQLLNSSKVNFCTLSQLRQLVQSEGIETNDQFYTWIQYCHDRGLVFCDLPPSLSVTAHCRCTDENDIVVVLQHSIVTEACRTLLSLDSSFCFKGILHERLTTNLFSENVEQKAVILRIFERADIIVRRIRTSKTVIPAVDRKQGSSFLVPCCVPTLSDTADDFYIPNSHDITLYFCFTSVLPDALFYHLVARTYRWSQSFGGDEPQVLFRRARFFLDNEHDFVLSMPSPRLARIQVCVLRVTDEDDVVSNQSDEHDRFSPRPYASAKVRNFIEASLSDCRESWMRNMSYSTCVQCICDQKCKTHQVPRCSDDGCLHFLDLDQCLSHKVVCCDFRRVPTASYRKGFPAPAIVSKIIQPSNGTNIELPVWVKSSAKMLNGGSEGQDWIALAQKLGYKQHKIDKLSYELNPGLLLLTDWIISSGNTALSVDLLISYLEQMNRPDVVDVVQQGQESDVDPPQVFISYQWDNQDEVTVLRDVLEKNGFTCWMDIGQMGGGDYLYNRIYDGIKNAKLVIACLTPKYVTSHHCCKEIALADLLRKPIIPVMFELIPWPPGGAMSLIFAQLVYINLKSVGGHGGSGIHADIDDKYCEIVARILVQTAPHAPRPYVSLNSRTNGKKRRNKSSTSNRPSAASPGVGHARDTRRGNRAPVTSVVLPAADGDPVVQESRVDQVHVPKCAVCTLL